jgi:hypothetical protein
MVWNFLKNLEIALWMLRQGELKFKASWTILVRLVSRNKNQTTTETNKLTKTLEIELSCDPAIQVYRAYA